MAVAESRMWRSERHGCLLGTKVELAAVNSEHLRKPKNARQNMASNVESVDGLA